MTCTDGGGTAREGLVVDGRLRLEERLGAGAMGEVWRATHFGLASTVAVKLLSPKYSSRGCREVHVAPFLREASLARRVDCAHVVRVMECAVSPGLGPYIVMEMLDGLDLYEHLARCGTLDVVETAVIAAQLCVGLEALHAADVFHLDVKPENVLMATKLWRPCATLIDFSIARDGTSPVDETICGTPAYLSPERIQGTGGADPRADLWALAVLAYECLVGKVPFDDRTLGTVCVALEHATFSLPSAFRADVPPGLDAWFGRALARDPQDRFATAAEMREAIIEACSPVPLARSWCVRAARAARISGVRLSPSRAGAARREVSLVSSAKERAWS
jgi:serine/threonine protein kinase